MEDKLTVPTIVACQIAGLARDRFNEHIFDGVYTCAPSTVRGRSRRFYLEDVAALSLYAALFREGFSKARAGELALDFLKALRSGETPLEYHTNIFVLPDAETTALSAVGRLSIFDIPRFLSEIRAKMEASK